MEPNPDSAQARPKTPRDRIVEATAGSGSGTARFTVFQSDYLSSIDPAMDQDQADTGEVIESVLVTAVVNLANLHLNADPDQPCQLSIDCEGADLEVLRGNDWSTFTPRISALRPHRTVSHLHDWGVFAALRCRGSHPYRTDLKYSIVVGSPSSRGTFASHSRIA